ncbi:MAG: hypothetical protein V1807_00605 [Patescibacteria group bacterium]
MVKQWLIWGLTVSLVILGGCAVKTKEPPVVFEKMTKMMSKLEQMEFSGDFEVVGTSNLPLLQGLKDLQITGTGRTNLTDVSNVRYLLNLIISGQSQEGTTRIGAELRSFPESSYFRLTDIDVPLGLPFSLSADNKWYQIKSAGQNKDWLGSSQPLTNTQVQQIRVLIAQSKLFNVVQKFPDVLVGGTRTYHWQVAVGKEAVTEFFQAWAKIANPPDSLDWKNWANRIGSYQYEFWISKYDYRLMKVNVVGQYDDSLEHQMSFALTINLDRFNAAQSIDQPTNVQEFNLRQLLGLPALP